MGYGIKKIFAYGIMIFLFFFSACEKNEEKGKSDLKEEIKSFSLKQFSNKFSFTLEGETAEITENREKTKIKSPILSLKTPKEIIEITTGKSGKAEIKMNPNERKVEKIVMTGNIRIVHKNKKSGEIMMEATCGKLTYDSKKQIMIMEISPRIKRGKNSFAGEKIFYDLKDNTLEIRGKVNVQIYPSKKINSD